VKLRQMATLVFATFQPPPQLSATKGMSTTTTACQTRVVETSRVSDVCKALAVPREAAKGTATASPTTQLAGARAMGSTHRRGWKAHGTRREGWAPLPPAEEPGRGRGGRWRRWRGRRRRERGGRGGGRRQRGRAWPWRRLSGHGGLGAAARRRDSSAGSTGEPTSVRCCGGGAPKLRCDTDFLPVNFGVILPRNPKLRCDTDALPVFTFSYRNLPPVD